MVVLKIIGIILLVLLALTRGIQVLIGVVLLVGVATNPAGHAESIVGRLLADVMIEALIIAGLIALIRSFRKKKLPVILEQSGSGDS